MGVQARLVLWTPDEATARRAARAAFARLGQVDRALSDWLVDGELARLEATAGGPALAVSEDLYRCLERSLEIARATDGAFDPTLGALTRLWREARRAGVAPDAAALETARERAGWRHVELDPAARTVRLALAGMRLDFGGVGKGWGADRALETLAAHGVERALVGLSGDHVLGQAPPHAPGWRILAGTRPGNQRELVLARCAVATSGDSEQFFELDGVRTSHILDPRTGLGVVARPLVTVVAPDGATADALASAVSVVGPDEAAALVQRFEGVRVYFEAP
jgi:thiamine biosynthesis lipoprotein